mgnify:FL=1
MKNAHLRGPSPGLTLRFIQDLTLLAGLQRPPGTYELAVTDLFTQKTVTRTWMVQ